MKYGNRSRFISSPFALVVLAIIFIFLVKAVWGIREKVVISNSKLNVAEIELAKLEEHRQDLANQINYLSTDQGIEAELRTKYRAVHEGESVAVIVDENDQSASAMQSISTSSQTEDDNAGWWSKVLRVFGF